MPDETKEAKSLTAAVDAHKTTLALATGTLVFSVGLLKENLHFSCWAKWLLGISWCLLGVSIVAGSLVHLRVPMMIAEDKPNIHDQLFEIPGKIHHTAFVFGVILLGVAMIVILAAK
jgi:hypothetical protein